MRLGRLGHVGRAVVVAALGISVLAAGAPAAAYAVNLDGQAAYWKISRSGVKGLVVVSEGVSTTVAFHLTGLLHRHDYALGGFDSACGAPLGASVFLRDFTSNARGNYWDPVRIAGGVASIASIQVRDMEAGTDVLCAGNGARGGPSPAIAGIKLKGPNGVRGLAVVDETSSRRVVLSFSGLAAGAAYQVVGRGSGCASSGPQRFSIALTATAAGMALKDVITWEPGIAGDVATGSVRLRRGATQVTCGTPFNVAA